MRHLRRFHIVLSYCQWTLEVLSDRFELPSNRFVVLSADVEALSHRFELLSVDVELPSLCIVLLFAAVEEPSGSMVRMAAVVQEPDVVVALRYGSPVPPLPAARTVTDEKRSCEALHFLFFCGQSCPRLRRGREMVVVLKCTGSGTGQVDWKKNREGRGFYQHRPW